MALPPGPWKLADDEWEVLRGILEPVLRGTGGRGRPRVEDCRSVAEICLFRSYNSLGTGRCHTFGWNLLPLDGLGISASTANRRFREWNASGAWPRLWEALQKLRQPKRRLRPRKVRKSDADPVTGLLVELQRAYHFFNGVIFGSTLPKKVAIIVIRGQGQGDPLGYFCGRAWRWGTGPAVDLIAISGAAVGLGAEAALETLIHEMVHNRNNMVGVVDCTNRGFYHNRHFRDSAVLSGLVCAERDAKLGYGVTGLGERSRRAIERLRPKTDLFRRVDP